MSSSPQNHYFGTPSGTARKSSMASLNERPADWSAHKDEEAQREQDLDAARQLSRARGPHGEQPVPGMCLFF